MKKVSAEKIMVAIDIGTTKISVIIAQCAGNDIVDILGIGKAPSEGLRKGVVVDIGKTVHSIKSAVKEAELMSGKKVESAYIGIAGSHIQSFNSHGVVPIKRGAVSEQDIHNVMQAAKAVAVPEEQQILHVLPQYFIIDGDERVLNPLGMHGIRLETQAHVITGSIASAQNLITCCEAAGIHVKDVVLEQLASAYAVLSNDECQLGVGVLDIGGGTADFALYHNGGIKYTMVLPVAGNHFTNDLAIGLHTTLSGAEAIKKEHGLADIGLLDQDEMVCVPSVNGEEETFVKKSEIISILQPRAEELLDFVYADLASKNLLPLMTTGIVLTGGGSLLRGMKELTQKRFSMSARVGKPHIKEHFLATLLSPMYATGYGLLLYGIKKSDTTDRFTGPLYKRMFERMRSWVSEFF